MVFSVWRDDQIEDIILSWPLNAATDSQKCHLYSAEPKKQKNRQSLEKPMYRAKIFRPKSFPSAAFLNLWLQLHHNINLISLKFWRYFLISMANTSRKNYSMYNIRVLAGQLRNDHLTLDIDLFSNVPSGRGNDYIDRKHCSGYTLQLTTPYNWLRFL